MPQNTFALISQLQQWHPPKHLLLGWSWPLYDSALCHQPCRWVYFCRVLQAWAEHFVWLTINNTSCLHASRLARNLGLFSAADINFCSHSEGSHLPPLGWKRVCLGWLQADRRMCTWKARDRWRRFVLQLMAQGLSPLLVTGCCVLYNLYWGRLHVRNS